MQAGSSRIGGGDAALWGDDAGLWGEDSKSRTGARAAQTMCSGSAGPVRRWALTPISEHEPRAPAANPDRGPRPRTLPETQPEHDRDTSAPDTVGLPARGCPPMVGNPFPPFMVHPSVSIHPLRRFALLSALVSLGLIVSSPGLTAQNDPSCAIDDQDRADLLALGYEDFDQNPGTGWRALVDETLSCVASVAGLIDAYAEANADDLTRGNLRILSWHAGQLYGLAGDAALARERFMSSINPDETADMPAWNAYVRASVAFLDGDMEELTRQRTAIAQSPGQMNLDVVDRLIAGFGRSYLEAYTGR